MRSPVDVTSQRLLAAQDVAVLDAPAHDGVQPGAVVDKQLADRERRAAASR